MLKVINEDCLTGMQKVLADGSVDVIVTSPPYNLGTDYGVYNDRISRKKYLEWMLDIAYEMHRVLSYSGSLFLNLGSKPTDPWVAYDVLSMFRYIFKLQNTFIWVKSITVDGRSHGHFKPLNSKRFVNNCWESIFHLTKDGNVPLDRLAVGVPYEDKTNMRRWKGNDDLRCRGNVWYLPYATIQRNEERPHPATFPVQLAKNCLLVHGVDRINLALDPFLGIGSSAKAAQELGVDFIGFEIDSAYCAEALKLIGENHG
jgi:site-specific DNA-methyltransferase (adenine-specific)